MSVVADVTGDLYRALGRLVYSIITRDSIGNQMSAFTDALSAMTARVAEDVAHLQDLLAQALATDVEDEAKIASLTASAAETQASIDDAIAQMGKVDPVPDFPPAPAPAPEPVPAPPAEPPVAPSN